MLLKVQIGGKKQIIKDGLPMKSGSYLWGERNQKCVHLKFFTRWAKHLQHILCLHPPQHSSFSPLYLILFFLKGLPSFFLPFFSSFSSPHLVCAAHQPRFSPFGSPQFFLNEDCACSGWMCVAVSTGYSWMLQGNREVRGETGRGVMRMKGEGKTGGQAESGPQGCWGQDGQTQMKDNLWRSFAVGGEAPEEPAHSAAHTLPDTTHSSILLHLFFTSVSTPKPSPPS